MKSIVKNTLWKHLRLALETKTKRLILERNLEKEVNEAESKIKSFCDSLFKFFGWCTLTIIFVSVWQSTQFGVFLIVASVMFISILSYITAVVMKAMNKTANALHRKGLNVAVNLIVSFLLALITLYITSNTLLVGLEKLKHAQSCSMYHKGSKEIPQSCRKYVRM